VFAVFFGVAALLALYSIFIEPGWLQTTTVPVALPRASPALAGLTIVQLSDLHYPSTMSARRLRRAVAQTNALQPDAVVLTGDYLDAAEADHARQTRNAAEVADILGGLHAKHGVYAIWGNHDIAELQALQQAFTARGITVLCNKVVPIEHGGDRLWLLGLDDVWGGSPRPSEALRGVPAGACTIALMHEPDYADTLAACPVDLQLSGHSHAGQIRLPFIGPLHVPHDSHRYPDALRRAGNMLVYTNRGLGTTGLPIRFNARPEITRIVIHPTPIAPNPTSR
jgi:predicted MPP superfamily phosphohydrolase